MSTEAQDHLPDEPTDRMIELPLVDGDVLHVVMNVDELGVRRVRVMGDSLPFQLCSDEVRMLADAMECWPEVIEP